MPASKKKMDYDKQWQADNVDRIEIRPNKIYNLPARVAHAVADGKSTSKTAYIVEAVIQRLQRDGYNNIDQQDQKDQ